MTQHRCPWCACFVAAPGHCARCQSIIATAQARQPRITPSQAAAVLASAKRKRPAPGQLSLEVPA